MKEEEQRIALAELYGYPNIQRVNKGEFGGLRETLLEEKRIVPSFVRNLDDLSKLLEILGVKDRSNNILRVKWVNNLRTIVSRRMPKNKSGTALTSDVDLLLANPEEIAESILKTFNKWVE
jgi:hypothetical protein